MVVGHLSAPNRGQSPPLSPQQRRAWPRPRRSRRGRPDQRPAAVPGCGDPCWWSPLREHHILSGWGERDGEDNPGRGRHRPRRRRASLHLAASMCLRNDRGWSS